MSIFNTFPSFVHFFKCQEPVIYLSKDNSQVWSNLKLPTHGYNKDGYSDYKQIIFGLNSTEDGNVLMSYEIYDGNTMVSSIHVSN